MISSQDNGWFILSKDVISHIFDYLTDDDLALIQDLSRGMKRIVNDYLRTPPNQRECKPLNYCKYGATYGSINLLKWGLELRHSTQYALMYAAANGHVNVIEWASMHNIPLCANIHGEYLESVAASENGHTAVLDWLHKKTGRCSHFHKAVANNHIGVLQWAIKNGYKLDLVIKEIIFHERKKMYLFMIKNVPGMKIYKHRQMAYDMGREDFGKWILVQEIKLLHTHYENTDPDGTMKNYYPDIDTVQ